MMLMGVIAGCPAQLEVGHAGGQLTGGEGRQLLPTLLGRSKRGWQKTQREGSPYTRRQGKGELTAVCRKPGLRTARQAICGWSEPRASICIAGPPIGTERLRYSGR